MEFCDIVGETVYMLGFDTGVLHEITSAAYPSACAFSSDVEVSGVLALEIGGVRHDILLAENPSDGYRSYSIPEVISPIYEAILQFAESPQQVVLLETDTENQEMCQVVDTCTGHVWLEFGTNNKDAYYPYAFCRWYPKES